MTGKKILLAVLLSIVMAGCSSLPQNVDRKPSFAFVDTRDTYLGRALQKSRSLGMAEDGFVLLETGLDAFVARAALAEVAERSIDVQYYLYHNDLVGRLFSALLLQAADRGVRVRVLVDDMDMGGREEQIIAFDSHPNIEVRLFNPFDRSVSRNLQFIGGFGSITRRMHNKSFTVDNIATILGGRNIGDEYFEADPAIEFADLDVLAVGKIVPEVSKAFDLYWNSQLAYPATSVIGKQVSDVKLKALAEELRAFINTKEAARYISALHNSQLAEQIKNQNIDYFLGDAKILVDHPDKITSSRDANELHLAAQLEPYFQNVKKELMIVSPYFVPGREGVDLLAKLVKKGVRVVVLTNSLESNDVMVVHAGYSRYRKALLRSGVELYEMNYKLTRSRRREKKKKGIGGSSRASLHAKTFVLDGRQVFIGSLNLDPRSFYENTEIGLVLDCPEMAAVMVKQFLKELETEAFRLELKTDGKGNEQLVWHGKEKGRPVVFYTDPYSSFWHRFLTGLLSLLPIESQL